MLEETMNNIPNLIKPILTSLTEKFKPFLYGVGILVILYTLYLIIKFIFSWIRERRIKKTYQNTEEILSKLEKIEEKLDKIAGKKHKELEKEKPEAEEEEEEKKAKKKK